MTEWDNDQDWIRFKEELANDPKIHMCPKWEERQSYYENAEFTEVLGFGADGGPHYGEEFPDILKEATFCLFCGARLVPVVIEEGPLLRDLPITL